jgi:hypothetical protein
MEAGSLHFRALGFGVGHPSGREEIILLVFEGEGGNGDAESETCCLITAREENL